jgi:hypothetical protein
MTIKDLLKDAYKEGMTAEEIAKALEGIDLPDSAGEIERLTKALNKSNSEAADYKRQLREKMSAEEIEAKETADKIEALTKERDTLLREKTVAGHKANYLALGYDEKLAVETAEAMVSGDIAKVFANQKKHQEALDKKIRADVLKETPKPEGGGGKATTIEDIMKITDSDARQAAIAENIDLFNNK